MSRVLVVVFAVLCFCLPGVAGAQRFSLGARVELILNFAQVSSFAPQLSGEARGLVGAFGVRGSLGFSDGVEISLDGVYRFDGLNQGLLYLAGGLGFSRTAELRGVVGYEWDIGSNLRVCAEGVARFPFLGEPRLGLSVGLVYLLPKG